MSMTGVVVVMLVSVSIAGVDADQVEHRGSNASLGPDGVRKTAQCNRLPVQHYAFQTVAVIQLYRGRRGDQVMMGALHFGQAAHQLAHAPIIDIRQVCHAVLLRQRDAIARTIVTLPEVLRRSLTWDQGAEMAQHARLKIDAGVQVYFCDQ